MNNSYIPLSPSKNRDIRPSLLTRCRVVCTAMSNLGRGWRSTTMVYEEAFPVLVFSKTDDADYNGSGSRCSYSCSISPLLRKRALRFDPRWSGVVVTGFTSPFSADSGSAVCFHWLTDVRYRCAYGFMGTEAENHFFHFAPLADRLHLPIYLFPCIWLAIRPACARTCLLAL